MYRYSPIKLAITLHYIILHCSLTFPSVSATVRIIFADDEYAILYECYGEVDENGFCSDRVFIELVGRTPDTQLTEERRQQVS